MTQPAPKATVSDLTRKYDLWWQFTVRAVETRHRGSYLGIFWAVLNPLLSLALYLAIFGYILPGGKFHAASHETRVDYALALFAGLILLHVIAEVMAVAPTYIVANPNLVKKVVFPLDVLPLANVCAVWFHFFISLGLLLIASLVAGRIPPWTAWLWLPVILVPHFLFSLGLAWLLAALGVFFRDIAQVMGFAAQVVIWSSAIMIPLERIRAVPAAWAILKWNPLLHTAELMRDALLWDQPLNLSALAYTWGAGVAMVVIGAWFFRKWQSAFADVI